MVMIKDLIVKDITKCDEVIASNNVQKAELLCDEIVQSYSIYIPNITAGLDNYFWGAEKVDYIKDITLLKKKLMLYVAGGNEIINRNNNGISFTNTNTNANANTNTNTNTNVSVATLIQHAINDIAEDGSLSDEEISEITDKLKEIQNISESDERRNKKWCKLRPTLAWLSTKGVDIFCKIIPIVLKVIDK